MTTEVNTPRPASSEPPPDNRNVLLRGPQVRWPVFIVSLAGVLAMALWALFDPTDAESAIGDAVGKVTTWFGWFYILLATAILVFVIGLAISRYGNIRLGPDHSRPQYSTFAWTAMLFAAGIGTDVMFYSVVEPATQYLTPPVGEGGTVEAARDSTVWALFHYGISGWGMYALMGMALAYFAYRMNLPLAVRSSLYPIFGKRVDGPLGHAVDIAAVLGTIFGVATSLGIGVVFLNVGLNILFGVGVGTGAQVALAVLAVTVAAISATTGVDKGIRFLSQLNVILALGLAAWVLVTGKTAFILNAVVMNVGDFVRTFPAKTTETFAYNDASEWMSYWTLFFWAWWVAWAAFVGQFLARISRGRTIRQFVAGCLILPFTYILMWMSIFGNATVDRIRGGDEAFGEVAVDFEGRGYYELLQSYPLAEALIGLSVFIGLLFYVTSADSGALVMANLSSNLRTVQEDGAAWMRIVWAATTGLLTIAVLAAGGLYALQYATIIMGLPFAFVLVLVMLGLWKALQVEGRRADSGVHQLPVMLSARSDERQDTWRARLARATNFVDRARAVEYMHKVVEPALRDVAAELNAQGVTTEVRLHDSGDGTTADELPDDPSLQPTTSYVELATAAAEHPFLYRVEVVESPVPTYGGRMVGDRDRYARLEVHLVDGGQSYDVMGYTSGQVIHDCLDQYERHLEFLRMS